MTEHQSGSGIYEILGCQRRYIGSAKRLKNRFYGHIRLLRLNRHHCRHLQHAWNKHGVHAFTFRVLLYCSESDLLWFEQRALDSYGRDRLYNTTLTAGSSRGVVRSDEQKQKIATTLRGRKTGPLSITHRMKLSAARKRVLLSPEHRERARAAAMIALTRSRETRLAAIRSTCTTTEFRTKAGAINRGRTRTRESRARMAVSAKARGLRLHRERVIVAGGDPDIQAICGACHQVKLVTEMVHSKGNPTLCKSCNCIRVARYKSLLSAEIGRKISASEGAADALLKE